MCCSACMHLKRTPSVAACLRPEQPRAWRPGTVITFVLEGPTSWFTFALLSAPLCFSIGHLTIHSPRCDAARGCLLETGSCTAPCRCLSSPPPEALAGIVPNAPIRTRYLNLSLSSGTSRVRPSPHPPGGGFASGDRGLAAVRWLPTYCGRLLARTSVSRLRGRAKREVSSEG